MHLRTFLFMGTLITPTPPTSEVPQTDITTTVVIMLLDLITIEVLINLLFLDGTHKHINGTQICSPFHDYIFLELILLPLFDACSRNPPRVCVLFILACSLKNRIPWPWPCPPTPPSVKETAKLQSAT